MKLLIVIVFLASVLNSVSQAPLVVTVEKASNSVSIYAENRASCPISMTLNLDVVNMTHSHNPASFIVIPANSGKIYLTTLYSSGGKWSYKYNYKWYFGDVRNTSIDTSYVYELPYAIDSAYAVSQGYDGSFSHQGIKAIDFKMPEGTPIMAARNGKVAWVVQHNTLSCPTLECKDYANLVAIYHNDGSIGEYLHLQQNSVVVKQGDRVEAGQIIAKSGNTGFSSTPHLHFWTYRMTPAGLKSLPTKFRVGQQIVLLNKGYKYFRRAK
jgi:murein DD-endopeptidase MepM/ murein hydrolase activator NlpD